MQMIVEGELTNYGPAQIGALEAALASLAKIERGHVTVALRAASVLIEARLWAPSPEAAAQILEALSSTFATRISVNAFFEAVGLSDFKVSSRPQLTTEEGNVIIDAPSLPPSPPPSPPAPPPSPRAPPSPPSSPGVGLLSLGIIASEGGSMTWLIVVLASGIALVLALALFFCIKTKACWCRIAARPVSSGKLGQSETSRQRSSARHETYPSATSWPPSETDLEAPGRTSDYTPGLAADGTPAGMARTTSRRHSVDATGAGGMPGRRPRVMADYATDYPNGATSRCDSDGAHLCCAPRHSRAQPQQEDAPAEGGPWSPVFETPRPCGGFSTQSELPAAVRPPRPRRVSSLDVGHQGAMNGAGADPSCVVLEPRGEVDQASVQRGAAASSTGSSMLESEWTSPAGSSAASRERRCSGQQLEAAASDRGVEDATAAAAAATAAHAAGKRVTGASHGALDLDQSALESPTLSTPPPVSPSETPFERSRRIAWIKYYVSVGEGDRARSLGWDGLPFTSLPSQSSDYVIGWNIISKDKSHRF